jgi:hypothetical protein
MNTTRRSCPTKTNLLTAWQNASGLYLQAVAELSRKIGVLSKAEYEALAHAAEAARKSALESKAILEAHIAEHGCNRYEVAA